MLYALPVIAIPLKISQLLIHLFPSKSYEDIPYALFDFCSLRPEDRVLNGAKWLFPER